MGLLYPLMDCKDKVIEKILSSQEVVDLIDDQKIKTAPAFGLLYKKVFPYAFVPDTVDATETYICVETNIVNVKSDAICDVELIIHVISHIGIMRTDFGTRVDALADVIDELLNHSRDFGIGKVTPVERYPTSWTLPNYNYVCRKVTYVIKNFNFRRGAGDYG